MYISAALGVVLDVEHNRQRFYHGHTDDVICLATHPVRDTPQALQADQSIAWMDDGPVAHLGPLNKPCVPPNVHVYVLSHTGRESGGDGAAGQGGHHPRVGRTLPAMRQRPLRIPSQVPTLRLQTNERGSKSSSAWPNWVKPLYLCVFALCVLGVCMCSGVCHVAFSDDGSRLASVGLDKDHSVALHDWSDSFASLNLFGLSFVSFLSPSLCF